MAAAQRTLALAAQQRAPAIEASPLPPTAAPDADAPAVTVTALQVATLDASELDATLASPPAGDAVRARMHLCWS